MTSNRMPENRDVGGSCRGRIAQRFRDNGDGDVDGSWRGRIMQQFRDNEGDVRAFSNCTFGYVKNDDLLKSGPLGMCNDPYCTTCTTAYRTKTAPEGSNPVGSSFRGRFRNVRKDAKSWARSAFSAINSYFPIVNPYSTMVSRWNRLFVASCMFAIFLDPLFFFVLSVDEQNKCIIFHQSLAVTLVVIRSMTDILYFLHMLLQFRLTYVAPETRVVGSGDFVDDPKKIALQYLRGYFIVDLFVVLPLPQVMILVMIPKYFGMSTSYYAKSLLVITFLLQYVPRICRILPLLIGLSHSGLIFESALASFVLNLLMFVLAGHAVGSCWYLLGLQRMNRCLKNACVDSGLSNCKKLLVCGHAEIQKDTNPNSVLYKWIKESSSKKCLMTDNDFYGIYKQVIPLTSKSDFVVRYVYSLFWGFQQISTLAGNLIPSDYVFEVVFTMIIIGLGLLLFALLIGNMQNFLQSLGRRRLDMQLRRRDVELWMSHRRLPNTLRNHVREAERFNWAATRGANEEFLLQNLPENLQIDIRRHLFSFLKKVRIFQLMDEHVLDVVSARVRQKLYLRGSNILEKGSPVENMVFIVRGRLQSIGADGNVSLLTEGDVCGEELLTWYLEHASISRDGGKIRSPCLRLFSNRTVLCVTNVEAFALKASDLEDDSLLFAGFLRNPRVQGALRYESPYWRTSAAMRIQVAWRYRMKHLRRFSGSTSQLFYSRFLLT